MLFKSIATAGKFDHLSEIEMTFLEYARGFGDDLVVILYNDYRVDHGTTLRGLREVVRAEQLEALDCVDSVIISTHGQSFRSAPYTGYEPDDLSVEYELEQLRPHLFVTPSPMVLKHNEESCERLKIQTRFVMMEEYNPKCLSSTKTS